MWRNATYNVQFVRDFILASQGLVLQYWSVNFIKVLPCGLKVHHNVITFCCQLIEY